MSTKRKVKRALGWLRTRRGILWTLAGAVALLMACVAVYLAWRGFTLLTSESLEASDTGAGIQGLAAAVNLLATLCLVGVTTAYAFIAYKHLRLSGPDVSINWYLAWIDYTSRSSSIIKADIGTLHNGPPDKRHIEWFIGVDITNSGNQAISVEHVHLVVNDGELRRKHEGSGMSPACPIQLGAHSAKTLYFGQVAVHSLLDGSERLTSEGPHRLNTVVDLGSGSSLRTTSVPLQCFKRNPQ